MDKIIIEQLIDKGYTAPQIAAEVGKSEASVWRFLRKHGLNTARHIEHVDSNATEKKCRYCGKEKPLKQFPVAGGLKDKGKYRRWKCDECTQKTKNERRYRIRDQVRALKGEICCKKCGEPDFRVLDFHHNGDKSFNIGDAVKWGSLGKRLKKK
jgi:hypothetical protein